MKQTNIHESEKLNNLLYKRVKLILNDNTVHTGVLTLDDYSNRYKLDRDEMNKGPLCFYKSHVKKIEEISYVDFVFYKQTNKIIEMRDS